MSSCNVIIIGTGAVVGAGLGIMAGGATLALAGGGAVAGGLAAKLRSWRRGQMWPVTVLSLPREKQRQAGL